MIVRPRRSVVVRLAVMFAAAVQICGISALLLAPPPTDDPGGGFRIEEIKRYLRAPAGDEVEGIEIPIALSVGIGTVSLVTGSDEYFVCDMGSGARRPGQQRPGGRAAPLGHRGRPLSRLAAA